MKKGDFAHEKPLEARDPVHDSGDKFVRSEEPYELGANHNR
jgi:hypothetical protein